MKRLYSLSLLVIMSVVFSAGFLFAMDPGPGRNRSWDSRRNRGHGWDQGWERDRDHYRDRGPGPRHGPPEPPQKVTVSGALSLARGQIVLREDEDIYVIMGLGRFIGFIDGLKEGAEVTLDGFVRTGREDTNIHFLLANKLTIDGREYDDLAPPFQRQFDRHCRVE